MPRQGLGAQTCRLQSPLLGLQLLPSGLVLAQVWSLPDGRPGQTVCLFKFPSPAKR